MDQILGGLNMVAGILMETVGSLLGGALFLPALVAIPVGLVILIVMVLRELRR